MFRIKRRRTRIRLLSYATAGFIVTLGLAITGFWMAYALRMNIEYSYERSLGELSEHMNNIDLALQKAQYAGTMPQLVNIAGQIKTESVAAKNALSQISVSNVNFESTSKFIAQTGDYANSISRSLTESAKLTGGDRGKLKTLYKNSEKLSQNISDLVSDVQYGRITLFKSDEAIDALDRTKTQTVSAMASGFQSMEYNMAGLPSLIYDGPFSDNVLKKQPELTKGKGKISREAARGTAAKFLGLEEKALKNDGETSGNLPTYNFVSGTKNIYISKKGGYTVRMIDSRTPAASKLSTTQAVGKAKTFFKSHGILSMQPTYYLTNSNICVINCAYMQGQVTCYTDLIKIGIALDTGDIVSFDATGYIMNHKKRFLPAVRINKAAARAMLSSNLTLTKATLALIPKDGINEALCYEFKCTAENGTKNIIDYFNVTNGIEEQILILTKTPGGTLAM